MRHVSAVCRIGERGERMASRLPKDTLCHRSLQADRDGGEMRAWLVTPVALVVRCVSVLFDAGVAVAGDGSGQETYTNAQGRAASSRSRRR